MNRKCWKLATVVACLLLSDVHSARSDEPENSGKIAGIDVEYSDIAQALSSAAAASAKELKRLTEESAKPPTLADVKNQSLTNLFLFEKITLDSDVDKELEFSISVDIGPRKLVSSLHGKTDHGDLASVILPEYIKSIEVPIVDGSKAHGIVTFAADGCWRGYAHFSMRKVNEKWEVYEFRLPVRRIGTRMGADGMWKQFKMSEEVATDNR